MGRLTTHVLDTTHGKPGSGIRVEVYRLEDGEHRKLTETSTNEDGRCERPLLEGGDFTAGTYELCFHAGDYFDRTSGDLPEPKFLDVVPLRFGVSDADGHYHVPLLISPYSYSTYRGS